MMIDRRLVAVNYVFYGLAAVFLLFAAIGVADLSYDYFDGGHRWQQGDWLIHSLSGVVRRGTIGTGILLFSDALSLDPLAVTVAVQMIIMSSLMLAVCLIGQTVMTHPAQIVILLLPPFYPMMMVSRFDGMIYKEVIAMLSLALLTLAVVRPHHARWLMPLGVLVMIVGCFAHEALVFCFPIAALLIYLCGRNRFTVSLIAVLGIGTLAAFVFALTFSHGDPVPICAELLARGLGPILCEGPLTWIDASMGHAIGVTFDKAELSHLFEFFAFWLISVMVLGYLLGRELRQVLALGVLTLLPFLPLFVVAFDFGRWFSLGFSSLVFLLLATGGFRQLPGQGVLAIAALGVTSIVTYSSTTGIYLSGLVNRFVALVS